MDSQDGKKKKSPIKVVKDEDNCTTYTVPDDNIMPELRNLPVFPAEDFVIFPTGMNLLQVHDKKQIEAARRAMRESEHVVVMPVKPYLEQGEQPNWLNLDAYYEIGTHARILKINKPEAEGHPWQITLRGIRRVRPVYVYHDPTFDICRMQMQPVENEPLAIIGEMVYEDQRLLRTVRQAARQYFEKCPTEQNPKDSLRVIEQVADASMLADFLGAQIDMPFVQRAALLCAHVVRERLRMLVDIIANQLEVAKLVANAAHKVRGDMEKQQRDFFIRQHIKALKKQISDEAENDADELKKRIDVMQAPKEVREYTLKQWKRLSFMQQASAEYSVARAHIETLLDMPWLKTTEDHLNLKEARAILDEDHYGLEDVKERIIEHLAVLALKKDMKAPIVCLYGPPGVGKTSIGKSVARALGRKFERISLGGIHDESEIRGHRRTYVASMPGRIVQALRRAQSMNPVLMLDEIDKLAHDIHGDPSSALLEVLDPEQHHAFVDNYIETPINLSQVLFLTTANSLDTIPGPLRDRMEIIEIHSYTHVDKRSIANDFLLPKQIKAHGLTKSNLALSADALDVIISNYTREAGVRQLEQRLGAVCRKVAARVVEGREEGKKKVRVSIGTKNIEQFLGKKRYDFDMIEKKRAPGISTGMAWTPTGGDILFIETMTVPGKGDLILTGKLGDVMKESAQAAWTLVKARIDAETLEKVNVHLHVPAGATPKDGPSAGTAIMTALISLFKNQSVPTEIAMTGEISLRGNVLPVGGIREKVLAAHRAGIRTILMPKDNARDLDDVHESVRNDINFHFVTTVDEVLDIVFTSH